MLAEVPPIAADPEELGYTFLPESEGEGVGSNYDELERLTLSQLNRSLQTVLGTELAKHVTEHDRPGNNEARDCKEQRWGWAHPCRGGSIRVVASQ